MVRPNERGQCRGGGQGMVVGAVALTLFAAGCGGSTDATGVSDDDDPAGGDSFDIPGSWVANFALPEPLLASAAVEWNGMIYIVGGYAGEATGPATAHVLRLDPATLRVEALADYPQAVAEAAAVVYRDTLLVIGGNAGDRVDIVVSSAVRWYDAAADTWNPWGTMPEARYQHAAQTAADKIYVIGGQNVTRPAADSIVIFEGRDARHGPPPSRDFSNPAEGLGSPFEVATATECHRISGSGH